MSYSNWGKRPDGQQSLYTFTELQVDEVFKGTLPAKTLNLRELGGEKDGVGLKIPGSAQFARGEDVVVFLNSQPNADSSYELRGMVMGKYQIVQNDEGQEQLRGGRITPVHDESQTGAPPQKWTLAAFRELIAQQSRESIQKGESEHPIQILNRPASLKKGEGAMTTQPSLSSESSNNAIRHGATSDRPRWLTTVLGVLLGIGLYFWLRRKNPPSQK